MEISLKRPLPADAGNVTQWFGDNPQVYSRFKLAGHNGVDYAAPEGTSVLAAHNGTCAVSFDAAGYGNAVRINDDGGSFLTLYAHLSAVLVAHGEHVTAGQAIGKVGSTGFSSGPHLHWGLRFTKGKNPAYNDWVDPVPFRLDTGRWLMWPEEL